MIRVQVYTSALFDQIATLLVRDEEVDMSNVALQRWFAKGVSADIDEFAAYHQHLSDYVKSGDPSSHLTKYYRDFPQMFDWYGGDIVKSEHAIALMDKAGQIINAHHHFQLYPSAIEATRYLDKLKVAKAMQELTGCRWPNPHIKLVATTDIFDQCYVYPDTIICLTDPTFAEYVAMLAHEGGHILTLDLVNAPELLKKDRQLAFDMAEAIAHAIQMRIIDICAIRYEELLPGQNVADHESYIHSHPWRKQHAKLILRLVKALTERNGQPLAVMYNQVFDEFLTR